MTTLYQLLDAPDRTKTQLMYQATYFPRTELSDSAGRLIAWYHGTMLFKGQIVNMLNEDMTELMYAPHKKELQDWSIKWRFNNIPTQLEWERKSTRFIISCEFRVLLGGAKIALLSF